MGIRGLLIIAAVLSAGCDSAPSSTMAENAPVSSSTNSAATDATTTADQPMSIEEKLLPGISMKFIETNGIRMRIAEMGEGPVVLLAHGWPESWYSWRKQIPALAAAGYRVVVPDMRGYGETDAPAAVEDYNIVTLAADMVGVLDALGVEQATMVGHDWGAPVAAHSVLLHPQRFNALILLSVPYGGRGATSPMAAMRARTGDNFFYILYHNEAGGIAEAEYDSDPRGFLSRIYLSPDSPREAPAVTDPKRSAGGWIPRLGAAKGLPDWLSAEDLDYYVSQFEKSGFRGGVNYYRNIERNWELTENLSGVQISVPTLFIAGEKDIVIGGATKEMLQSTMQKTVADLRGALLIPGIGHWVQQEAPQETNQAILEFLATL